MINISIALCICALILYCFLLNKKVVKLNSRVFDCENKVEECQLEIRKLNNLFVIKEINNNDSNN